ncbi:MAG: radical SAM protein [Thermodesulfobacteriota bacterium]|nr:radical SAM protein [Thermodesulfobacteriota bacterium]
MSKLSFIIQEISNQALIPLCFRIGGKATLKPTVAGVFLTKRCNSRCTICEYWKNNEYSDELTFEEWKDVFDELKKTGVKMINFTADGEILTRKDSFEIMDYSKKLGFLISMNTNGLILNRHIDRIIELDPLQVQISLDAFSDENYKKIRGLSNGFTTVKRNIMELKESGYNKISIGSVLTKDNLDDIVKLQEFCLKNGFTYRITAFQFEGFGVDNTGLKDAYRESLFLLRLRDVIDKLLKHPINNTRFYLESMINYYKQDKYHPLNCIVGTYKIFILSNGDVSLCNIMHSSAVAGNVKENSLSEIWFGKKANEIRKKIREKECPSCWLSCFAEDNIRFSPLYLFKNIGYFGQKALRLFKHKAPACH